MRILKDRGDPATFFAQLARSTNRALLLDYDGTLAPFRDNPAEATPYPGVEDIIEDIIRNTNTRVVFISGRAVADLTPLLGIDPLPELWGSHGWEHRDRQGRYTCFEPSAAATACLARAENAASLLVELGGRIEKKPRSIAVHWRGLTEPHISALQARARELWGNLTIAATDVTIHAFDGGLELRITGHSKADAVRAVLDECRAPSSIAFLGDDLTDEDGFHALAGNGLGVLVRATLRPTEAALWLRPPDELLDFLRGWRSAAA